MAIYICTQCRYTETPRTRKRGSKAVESVAWMVFPFGIPYSLWRMLSKIHECRHCSSTLLVKVTSPMGKRLVALEEAELAQTIASPAARPPVVMQNMHAEINAAFNKIDRAVPPARADGVANSEPNEKPAKLRVDPDQW